MADGASHPTGQIRRENADEVLVRAMTCVAFSLYDDANQDTALYLIERALPLALSRDALRAALAKVEV